VHRKAETKVPAIRKSVGNAAMQSPIPYPVGDTTDIPAHCRVSVSASRGFKAKHHIRQAPFTKIAPGER